MRGMVKWLPFKSLVGQEKYIEELKNEKSKAERPILSEDQKEEINDVLISLLKNESVVITYFNNGRIISKEEIFIKCDLNNRRIYFKNISFDINNLLKIKKLNS